MAAGAPGCSSRTSPVSRSSTPTATRWAGSAIWSRCSGSAATAQAARARRRGAQPPPDLPPDDPGDRDRVRPGHHHRRGQHAALRAAAHRTSGARRVPRPAGPPGGDRRGGHRPRRLRPAAPGPPRLGDRQVLRTQGQGRGAAPQGRDADGRVVGGQRVLAAGGRAGRRIPGRHVRTAAPDGRGQRAAPPVAEAAGRGRGRSRRRPARRRPGGAARGRPGGDHRQAPGGARRRRPGGDGPGRRGRPAVRAARGGQGAAADADAAGRRGRCAAPDVVRGADRGRADDHRADHPAAGRDGRRRARPGPAGGPVPGARRPGVRVPVARRDADRQVPGHRALPAAAAGSAVRPGQLDRGQRSRPPGPGHPAVGRDELSGRVQPGLGARRRRERLAARCGDGRRRARPPAARGLAGDGFPQRGGVAGGR